MSAISIGMPSAEPAMQDIRKIERGLIPKDIAVRVQAVSPRSVPALSGKRNFRHRDRHKLAGRAPCGLLCCLISVSLLDAMEMRLWCVP